MTDKRGTEGQTRILSCVTMTATPAGIGEEETCLYRASWGFAGGIGLLPSRFHCNLASHRSEKHSVVHNWNTWSKDSNYMLSRAEHIR